MMILLVRMSRRLRCHKLHCNNNRGISSIWYGMAQCAIVSSYTCSVPRTLRDIRSLFLFLLFFFGAFFFINKFEWGTLVFPLSRRVCNDLSLWIRLRGLMVNRRHFSSNIRLVFSSDSKKRSKEIYVAAICAMR